MNQFLRVAQVLAPILLTVCLGMLAKRKQLLSFQECAGLQKFVTNFALPCVLFNSCLTADLNADSMTTAALLLPLVLAATLWAFGPGRKRFGCHNLPMLFAAKETGMLGIPLFIILFGADQAYKMGILDLTQAVIVFPVLAILAAAPGENPTLRSILRSVLTSPLMLMSAAGLVLNLTGLGDWLDTVGVGGVITECTGFLAQPVSVLMIFSVGYNFSLAEGKRRTVFRIALIHFVMYILIGGIIQVGLLLLTDAEPATRWAVAMYSTLPASFLAPGLARNEEETVVASGVCSVLTVVSMAVFCVMAGILA